jgi:hypothetical protein
MQINAFLGATLVKVTLVICATVLILRGHPVFAGVFLLLTLLMQAGRTEQDAGVVKTSTELMSFGNYTLSAKKETV